MEEVYLTEKFGAEYEGIIKTTKKFIPGKLERQVIKAHILHAHCCRQSPCTTADRKSAPATPAGIY